MGGKNVFLIGPGYIGSEILHHLTSENYSVTALVRSPSSAQALTERFGPNLKTVQGTLSDSPIITKHANEADIIIHSATADDLPSVQAVLEGIKQKVKNGGEDPIYIHTSGASLLADDSLGNALSDKIADDATPHDLDALADSAPHRNIDLAIIAARKELGPKGNKLLLMIPPVIDGLGEYGGGRMSIQIPTLTRFALKHGYAGHVGKGLAAWEYVNVRDLARGYMTILHYAEKARDGDKAAAEDLSGNPYFFCEGGETISWRDVAVHIGKELKKLGKIDSAEPQIIPEADYGDVFGPHTPGVAGCNARNRATRLRKLGWQPREKGVERVVVEDVIPSVLKE